MPEYTVYTVMGYCTLFFLLVQNKGEYQNINFAIVFVFGLKIIKNDKFDVTVQILVDLTGSGVSMPLSLVNKNRKIGFINCQKHVEYQQNF